VQLVGHHPMASRYAYARATAASGVRSQDSVGVYERGDVLVVVVADGGGGMRRGDAASRSVVAVVESAVADARFALEDARPWVDLFLATDSCLVANRAGETTGAVVVLGRSGFLGFSIGNSEAWVVTRTEVDNLTVGQHTRERFGNGHGTVVTFQRPQLAGVLLVATDGLFKYAAAPVIAGIARSGTVAQAADELLELVRLRSGKMADDVTVVLVRPDVAQVRPS
jgi:PPM family protein phosphatase